jgi:hypothetical protein
MGPQAEPSRSLGVASLQVVAPNLPASNPMP